MRRSRLKRARYSWKRKPRRESSPWLPRRIREDAAGMARLRREAFERSQGVCECGCGQPVDWWSGHLHHVLSRAKGGSDELDNLLFITPDCHKTLHGRVQWSKSA
jgi:5-methylcytosine-specific restriction endonuclease McrA